MRLGSSPGEARCTARSTPAIVTDTDPAISVTKTRFESAYRELGFAARAIDVAKTREAAAANTRVLVSVGMPDISVSSVGDKHSSH
jgi:hypothetical protein